MTFECPICGDEFEKSTYIASHRSLYVHIDWCREVEKASRMLEFGHEPSPQITPDQYDAAVKRAQSRVDTVQTRITDVRG